MNGENTIFPVFIKLKGKKVLVVGAGKIAQRRISALINHGADITVLAPTLPDELESKVHFIAEVFDENCAKAFEKASDYYDIVLAATNNREVNHRIYEIYKTKKVLVNICDAPEECDFYFPAIFENDDFIGGVVSKQGNKHRLVKELKQKLSAFLNSI